jgi:hypothetical protein
MRRKETNAVIVVIKLKVHGKRGKPKKRWLDTIENNRMAVGVCVRDIKNCDERKFRTRMIDPK